MSTTLAELRASIVDALQLAVPDCPNLYAYDPREGFDWTKKVMEGGAVRAYFIEEFLPDASALLDASDHGAVATIVGLRSVAEGAKVAVQDETQLILRYLRDIPFNRNASVAGMPSITVAGRFLCYQPVIAARFYALQTTS